MILKKDKRILITGKTICLVAGITSAIAFFYWLAKAIFSDSTDIPMLITSAIVSTYLLWFSQRGRKISRD